MTATNNNEQRYNISTARQCTVYRNSAGGIVTTPPTPVVDEWKSQQIELMTGLGYTFLARLLWFTSLPVNSRVWHDVQGKVTNVGLVDAPGFGVIYNAAIIGENEARALIYGRDGYLLPPEHHPALLVQLPDGHV